VTVFSLPTLWVLVVLATAWDLVERRIPNGLVLFGLVYGLGWAVTQEHGHGLLDAVGGATVALGLLIVPFSLQWMGGGDVKLAMVCGAFLGTQTLPYLLLCATAAHGFVSLAWWAAHRFLARPGGTDAVPFTLALAASLFALTTSVFPTLP
jgi:Flp pilus assembly protein protease CpaA